MLPRLRYTRKCCCGKHRHGCVAFQWRGSIGVT